jgi:hypothetical protein
MTRRDPVLISTVTAMPGDKLTQLVLGLHLCSIERYTGGMEQFLPAGLAAALLGHPRLIRGLVLRRVA